MTALQNFKNKPSLLSVTTVVIFILSYFVHGAFVFIAFIPLFALLDLPFRLQSLYILVAALFITALLAALVPSHIAIGKGLLYVTVLSSALIFYWVMQHFTHNRLNKLSLVILLIGTEYLILKIVPGDKSTFAADFLQGNQNWVRWNVYSGYLGVSAWILLVNLLFYQAILKNEKVNILQLLLAVMAIVLPVLYSLSLTNNALTKEQLIRFYSGDESELGRPYILYGELISRTGAWVSVLIIIFTLVRAKTKKVAR